MPRKYKFCTQKLQCCSKKTAQNSALRKWKFCIQGMKIPRSKMEILCSENGKCPQCHGKLLLHNCFVPNWLIPYYLGFPRCRAQIKIQR